MPEKMGHNRQRHVKTSHRTQYELPHEGIVKTRLVALALALVGQSEARAQWVLTVKQDEITDERIAVFRTTSITHTANAIRLPTKPQLLVRCSGAALEDVFVAVDAYVADMEGAVQLRFDRGTPIEEDWSTSTTNEALFSPKPDDFVDSLLTHKKLIFRYYPHQETPQTATFAIPSLTPQSAQFLKHCGFDPTKRLAILSEQRRLGAKQAAEDAARQRRDSLATVVKIELNAPEGVIEMSPSDTVYTDSLISRVVTVDGKELTDYRTAFTIEYPDQGRSLSYSGPTLPLEVGTNVVHVFVNGVQADRDLKYLIQPKRSGGLS